MIFSTEITSSQIPSDNPLFKRTLKAYSILAENHLGKTLEIGSGEGYGIPIYKQKTSSLSVIDKSKPNLADISKKFPDISIYNSKIPPLAFIEDNSFDSIVTFQVIEHLKNQDLFIKEVFRILKPNGTAYLTTPNKVKTIVRNPWHYKEFDYAEMAALCKAQFNNVKIYGIKGNAKTDLYYKKNKASVEKILKYDVLKLHNKLPPQLLRLPYEISNRLNRKKLQKSNTKLVEEISLEDYNLSECSEHTLDFYCILRK